MAGERKGWVEPLPESPPTEGPVEPAERPAEDGTLSSASPHPRFVQRRGRYRPWYVRDEGPFSRLSRGD